jgi:hypothetical protein
MDNPCPRCQDVLTEDEIEIRECGSCGATFCPICNMETTEKDEELGVCAECSSPLSADEDDVEEDEEEGGVE